MEGLESGNTNLGVGDLVLDVAGDVSPAVLGINEPKLASALGKVSDVSVGVLTGENREAVNVLGHFFEALWSRRSFLVDVKSTIMKNNYIQTLIKST